MTQPHTITFPNASYDKDSDSITAIWHETSNGKFPASSTPNYPTNLVLLYDQDNGDVVGCQITNASALLPSSSSGG